MEWIKSWKPSNKEGLGKRSSQGKMSDKAKVGWIIKCRLFKTFFQPLWGFHCWWLEKSTGWGWISVSGLLVMNQCSQTRISRGFTLIVDDSGHRKSGNFTAGVGRQYIGEIGKTDNGIVVVTTHLYNGKKSLPLDIELYQHASSLPQGKKDIEFKKKPELALAWIDRSLERKYRPGIVLIDAGYGNNTTFLLELEKRNLKYLGGLAKNRKVITQTEENKREEIRIDMLAQSCLLRILSLFNSI